MASAQVGTASWAMCSSLSQVALASLQRWMGYSNWRMENGLQIRNSGRCVVCDCCSGEPRICGHGWAAQQGSGGRGFARTARPIPVLPYCSARMRGAVWLGQPTILLVRGASWLRSVLGSCRLTASDRWRLNTNRFSLSSQALRLQFTVLIEISAALQGDTCGLAHPC